MLFALVSSHAFVNNGVILFQPIIEDVAEKLIDRNLVQDNFLEIEGCYSKLSEIEIIHDMVTLKFKIVVKSFMKTSITWNSGKNILLVSWAGKNETGTSRSSIIGQ